MLIAEKGRARLGTKAPNSWLSTLFPTALSPPWLPPVSAFPCTVPLAYIFFPTSFFFFGGVFCCCSSCFEVSENSFIEFNVDSVRNVYTIFSWSWNLNKLCYTKEREAHQTQGPESLPQSAS